MAAVPSVLELIHNRLKDGSSPGYRKDPFILAIAAEDGSMRWVVAAGLLARLETHGIFPDLIVGTSGGGLAASYFAGGAMQQGAMVIRYMNRKGFERDGVSRRFINPYRLLRGQPVMDVETTVDYVFTEKTPMPWAKLQKSPVPTYLTAVTGQGELVLQPLHGQERTAQQWAMKNTGRIPFIAFNPRDTTVLWDGGLRASIPLQPALDLGATHVLVVRCKGAQHTFDELIQPSWVETYVLNPALRLQAPHLLNMVKERPAYLKPSFDALINPASNIMQLALPRVDVGMMEDDEGALFRQVVKAYIFAGRALGLPDQPLPSEWQPEAGMYL